MQLQRPLHAVLCGELHVPEPLQLACGPTPCAQPLTTGLNPFPAKWMQGQQSALLQFVFFAYSTAAAGFPGIETLEFKNRSNSGPRTTTP